MNTYIDTRTDKTVCSLQVYTLQGYYYGETGFLQGNTRLKLPPLHPEHQ